MLFFCVKIQNNKIFRNIIKTNKMSLNDFLKSFKAGDNQCTHTRIGDISLNIYPGKYNFGEKETEFYENRTAAVHR